MTNKLLHLAGIRMLTTLIHLADTSPFRATHLVQPPPEPEGLRPGCHLVARPSRRYAPGKRRRTKTRRLTRPRQALTGSARHLRAQLDGHPAAHDWQHDDPACRITRVRGYALTGRLPVVARSFATASPAFRSALLGLCLATSLIPDRLSVVHAAGIEFAPTRAPAIDYICVDRTASYNPSPALTAAKEVLAAAIVGIPRDTGSQAHSLFLATISDNSYDPVELRATIQISAVPRKPTPPNTNTIDQDVLLAQLAAYQRATKAYRTALSSARRAALLGAQDIRTLPLPWEGRSTDAWGCIQRASEAGATTLVIASDMDQNGQQQVALRHPLRGVSVHIIDFRCGQTQSRGNQARVCEARKAYWNRAFARSGTTTVRWTFPGQPVGDLFGH